MVKNQSTFRTPSFIAPPPAFFAILFFSISNFRCSRFCFIKSALVLADVVAEAPLSSPPPPSHDPHPSSEVLEGVSIAAILAGSPEAEGGGVGLGIPGLGLDDFDLDKFKLGFRTAFPAPGRSSKNESELGSAWEKAEAAERAEVVVAGVESQL